MPSQPDPTGTVETLARQLMAESALFTGRCQYLISHLNQIQQVGILAGCSDPGEEQGRWLANFDVGVHEKLLSDLRIADVQLNRLISTAYAYRHKLRGGDAAP